MGDAQMTIYLHMDLLEQEMTKNVCIEIARTGKIPDGNYQHEPEDYH